MFQLSDLRKIRLRFASLQSTFDQCEFSLLSGEAGHTWCIGASPKTFDLDHGEFAILGGRAGMEIQVFLDRLEDLGGSASSKLAGCGGTYLDEVGGDWFAIVHRIEGGDLIESSCQPRATFHLETFQLKLADRARL